MARKKKNRSNPSGRPLKPSEKLKKIRTSDVMRAMKNGNLPPRIVAGTKFSIVSGGLCSPK